MKVKKLRQKLHKLCAKAGVQVPLLAFERWQFNCKLHETLDLRPSHDDSSSSESSAGEVEDDTETATPKLSKGSGPELILPVAKGARSPALGCLC